MNLDKAIELLRSEINEGIAGVEIENGNLVKGSLNTNSVEYKAIKAVLKSKAGIKLSDFAGNDGNVLDSVAKAQKRPDGSQEFTVTTDGKGPTQSFSVILFRDGKTSVKRK